MAKASEQINVLAETTNSGGLLLTPPMRIQLKMKAWLQSVGLPRGRGYIYFSPEEMEYRLEDEGEVADIFKRTWVKGTTVKLSGAITGKELEVKMDVLDFAAYVSPDFVQHIRNTLA